MPIKPVDVKVFSVEVAETIYSKIVAELGYTSMDITGLDYISAEPENVLIDYFPKNQIVYEISEVVDLFALNYHKVVDDAYSVPDHSSYVMSKSAAREILNIVEHYAADLHKPLFDTAIAEELVRLILSKAFDDYLVSTDAYALTTHQQKYDAVVTQDAFDRTVSFVRHFQDYVTIDDWAGIDKFFTGVKTNFAGAVDKSEYAFAKVLKDTGIVSDITLLLTTKNFFDTVSIPDAYLVELQKVFNDSSQATDHRIASFIKVLADGVTIPDHFVADFSKVTADDTSATDTFTKATQFIRSPNNPVTTPDAHYYSVEKVLHDTPASLDRSRGIMVKPLFDSTSASDFIALAMALAYADTTGASDAVSYSSEKVLHDATIALDVLVFTSKLVYADSVAPIDNVALSSTKPLTDTFGFLDGYKLNTAKAVLDTAVPSDTLNYDLNAVLKDNVVALTDVSKIFKLKPVNDSIGTSDSFNTTTVFSRKFYDAVVLDDFMDAEGVLDASKFNIATTIDNLATNTNKVLENPCFVVDLPAIIYTKSAQDIVGTQDSYVFNNIKGVTEVVPITDTVDIVTIVGTTSIFNAFAFNTSTFG